MRAGIYGRVSTADGRQDAENQLTELRRFADLQNWGIFDEYIDHESGGRKDRDEFRRLLSDAAERRFDVVLVWALDRFTREGIAEPFEYIKRLKQNGVEFVSLKEEHFRTTGPAGELMVAIAAWIAKQERIPPCSGSSATKSRFSILFWRLLVLVTLSPKSAGES